jgi:hypothetical protein
MKAFGMGMMAVGVYQILYATWPHNITIEGGIVGAALGLMLVVGSFILTEDT